MPYKCSLAVGTANAAAQSGSRWVVAVADSYQISPRMFSMTAGASSAVPPKGKPAIARACCANWLVTQAFIV
ncbi:hypothetical protein D3C71_2060350 [compost metagenome]